MRVATCRLRFRSQLKTNRRYQLPTIDRLQEHNLLSTAHRVRWHGLACFFFSHTINFPRQEIIVTNSRFIVDIFTINIVRYFIVLKIVPTGKDLFNYISEFSSLTAKRTDERVKLFLLRKCVRRETWCWPPVPAPVILSRTHTCFLRMSDDDRLCSSQYCSSPLAIRLRRWRPRKPKPLFDNVLKSRH